jgi:hypothetical protein
VTLATLSALYLHGFGTRYDLPLALSLYLFSAAGVVVISFVLVTVFATERVGEVAVRYPRRELSWLRGLPLLGWLRSLCGLLGVVFLVLIVISGWFGPGDPVRNPAEYLTWIYFWVGFVALNGLVGPLGSAFNPFCALNELVRRLRRSPPEPEDDRLSALGLWPAVVLLFAFACLELTSGYANRPWLVATLLVLYTCFTVAGMQIYGTRPWLSHLEVFSVLFSVLNRFAPIQVEEERVYMRPWGAGLLDSWPAGWDRVLFVILMLSTIAFDGLLATPLWQDLSTALEPYWQPFGQFGFFAVRTFGLLGVSLLFLVVFVASMRLVIYLGSVRVDPVQTMSFFALTLVPIAFVYNVAHYYSYLVIGGQGLIPLLADPLGRGWRLLPTQGYQPSFTLAQAATVWYIQMVLIVLGHVVAVFLAHLRAGERFRSAQNVLLSQYPVLVLMVLYTMTSLWILAQPSTRGG